MIDRKRLRTWQDAVVSCGLQVVKASSFWAKLEARAGQVEVRIETAGTNRGLTRIVVQGPRPPELHVVWIRPESPPPLAREIKIGDDFFDKTFFIEGPTRLLLALLDAEMRRLLLRVNDEGRLELSLVWFQVDLPDEKVSSALPLLLGIRERFAQPMDVPQRLADNARKDPEAGVRLQSLLLLIREYPEDPRTVEVLRTACADPSPEIRLRAAKELGAEGRDVLLKLAESRELDTVSAEAISALDRELPFDRARAILEHALDARRLRTAHACLKALGNGGTAAAVGVLAQVMGQEKGELAAVAAQALGATGSPAAEPSLIQALQREERDLRVAAANALGRVGSAAAVLLLKEAAERSWPDLDLRRATRQAIAEIQSRLQGASPGQLSLAGAEAGQLSLAQDGAGQLSIARDQDGQLSISGEGKPNEA